MHRANNSRLADLAKDLHNFLLFQLVLPEDLDVECTHFQSLAQSRRRDDKHQCKNHHSLHFKIRLWKMNSTRWRLCAFMYALSNGDVLNVVQTAHALE